MSQSQSQSQSQFIQNKESQISQKPQLRNAPKSPLSKSENS